MALFSPVCFGAELFGVQLQSATLDQIRDAAKQAGALLIREGGENQWFDVYASQNLLAGSSQMYLGYVKQSRQLAFVEYEFHGLQNPEILLKLRSKYGNPDIRKGKYISDQRYFWQQDGIEIMLSSDWQNYRTRLSYINPRELLNLKKERTQSVMTQTMDEASRY